jgi:chondroitin AC lyase
MANNSVLEDGVMTALDYWLALDPRNPNWWWNVIGIPMDIGKVALLLDWRLSEEQSAGIVGIMARAVWKPYTGANLVWVVGITLNRALFVRDLNLTMACFNRLWAEVVYVNQPEEGIQVDGSFHQHGPQVDQTHKRRDSLGPHLTSMLTLDFSLRAQLLAMSYGAAFSTSILE